MFPESEIDKLTEVIGVFGKFQFTYTVLYGMSAIVMAFSGLGTKFLIYDVDHWCTIPSGLNITVKDWLNISAPYLPGEKSKNSCRFFITMIVITKFNCIFLKG